VTDGPRVLLYVRAGCRWCEAKRAELAARGAHVTEIAVGTQGPAVTELLKLTGGRRIVPVIVEDGRVAVAPDGGSAF
jgi:glutaredoxin